MAVASISKEVTMEFGMKRVVASVQVKETYTVRVEGVKVWVEVVNRKASYVATAMTGMRRLRALPGQVS